jgi:hypothetical protein
MKKGLSIVPLFGVIGNTTSTVNTASSLKHPKYHTWSAHTDAKQKILNKLYGVRTNTSHIR